jgi:outer membrane immunogenic protein
MKYRAKTVLLSTAIAAVFSTGALAADLPVRGPAYQAPPPAYSSWTGYYFGGNIGYSWGRATNDFTLAGFPTVSERQDVDGVIGGFQSGYNWQAGQWVMGMESDLQASGQKGSTGFLLPAATSLDAAHKLSWFGTARSRIGILVTPSVLLYGTAGVAYGQVKSDYLFTPGAAVLSFKDTKAGWTGGAGIEAALAGNWSAKLEYLYLDLGKNELTTTVGGANVLTVDRRFQDHIARVGVNYRFGGGGPVYANY